MPPDMLTFPWDAATGFEGSSYVLASDVGKVEIWRRRLMPPTDAVADGPTTTPGSSFGILLVAILAAMALSRRQQGRGREASDDR